MKAQKTTRHKNSSLPGTIYLLFDPCRRLFPALLHRRRVYMSKLAKFHFTEQPPRKYRTMHALPVPGRPTTTVTKCSIFRVDAAAGRLAGVYRRRSNPPVRKSRWRPTRRCRLLPRSCAGRPGQGGGNVGSSPPLRTAVVAGRSSGDCAHSRRAHWLETHIPAHIKSLCVSSACIGWERTH